MAIKTTASAKSNIVPKNKTQVPAGLAPKDKNVVPEGKKLTIAQREKYEKIKANKGPEAANAYKQKIIAGLPDTEDAPPPVVEPTPTIKYTDPNAVAARQGEANTNAATDSVKTINPNQTTDFGARTTTIGADGNPVVDTRSTGVNKELLDTGQGLGKQGLGIAGDTLGAFPTLPYNPASIDPRFALPSATNEDRQRIEGEIYGKLTQDLDENYKLSLEDKKQELADRGIPLGSELYTREMDRLDKGYQRAKTEARSQATIQGGQELSTQFNLGMQSHQQALGNYQSTYNFPLAIAATASGLGMGYQDPNFQPVTGTAVSPVDHTGLSQIATGAAESAADRASAEKIAKQQLKQQQSQFAQTLAEQKARSDAAARAASQQTPPPPAGPSFSAGV